MITSITKTAERNGNIVKILHDRDMLINVQSVQDLITYVGPVPNGPYEVTWALDPNGPFTVCKGSAYILVKKRDHSNPKLPVWRWQPSGYVVCFLPKEWIGYTVSRTVSPV